MLKEDSLSVVTKLSQETAELKAQISELKALLTQEMVEERRNVTVEQAEHDSVDIKDLIVPSSSKASLVPKPTKVTSASPAIPICCGFTREKVRCKIRVATEGKYCSIHHPKAIKCSGLTKEHEPCGNVVAKHGDFCFYHSGITCSGLKKDQTPCGASVKSRGDYCRHHKHQAAKK